LYAIDSSGQQKWNRTDLAGTLMTPTLDTEGRFHFGTDGSNIYALYANGTTAWIQNSDGESVQVLAAPLITDSGVLVYKVASYQDAVVALDSYGEFVSFTNLYCEYNNCNDFVPSYASPVHGVSGEIIIPSSYGLYGVTLQSVPDYSFQINWQFYPNDYLEEESDPPNGIAVASDGIAYFACSQYVFAIDTTRFDTSLGDNFRRRLLTNSVYQSTPKLIGVHDARGIIYGAPALRDGVVYVATSEYYIPPSSAPTLAPTDKPSSTPSVEPSAAPTFTPTDEPTAAPVELITRRSLQTKAVKAHIGVKRTARESVKIAMKTLAASRKTVKRVQKHVKKTTEDIQYALPGQLLALTFAVNVTTELWAFNANRSIYSMPTLGADGTIYFGDESGHFYALSSTGSKLWSHDIGYENAFGYAAPVIAADGTLYAASENGVLYAFDAAPTAAPTAVPSLAPNKKSDSKVKSLSAGGIAGIVIGVFVFVLLLIGLVFWFFIRGKYVGEEAKKGAGEGNEMKSFPSDSNAGEPVHV
jgi:outer membrane protein assembly factor BamB